MKIFAVFGNPILHSKSPQLFNSAFENFKVDAFYTRIRPQSATDIIDIIKKLPLAGANITAPYKEDALNLLDEFSIDAKAVGAVNTVVNYNGRLIGHNTDHVGVTESLKNAGINLSRSKCLVLGGGGAARAAVYGLKKSEAEVYICNRTLSKAQIIASDFGCKVLDWNNFDSSIDFDVVVSTLLPEAIPPFLQSLKFYFLLDASYKSSAVSRIASEMNVEIIEGKWWLIHQAVAAYELFLGVKPSFESMASAFDVKLDKEKLRIETFPLSEKYELATQRVDLIVSTKSLDASVLKNIVDEEIGKAFGS
jgi:shikimate dehydrogenase